MAHPIIAQSGFPSNEYMIVLRPPEVVRDRLDQIREKVRQRIPLGKHQNGFNHILISTFRQYAMSEEKLLVRLRHAVNSLAPFRLQYHQFGSLPTHTVFADVPAVPAFQQMVRALKEQQSLLKMPRTDAFFVTMPKIVIAQKLGPQQFDSIWPWLSQKQVRTSFIAESLLLLRRRSGEGRWQILERIAFENLPVNASQGVLF